MTIQLFLQKAGSGAKDCSGLNECFNITTQNCTNCQPQLYRWLKICSTDTGTWFYQIKMINNLTGEIATQTDGTDNFIVSAPATKYITFFDVVKSHTSVQWGGTVITLNVTVNTTINSTNFTVFGWNGLTTSGPWTQLGNWTYK